MTPPMRASKAACSTAVTDAAACGAAPWPTATLASSNACFAVVVPIASSTTRTPPASAGAAVDSALRSRRSIRPSRVTVELLGRGVPHQRLRVGEEEGRADGPGIQSLGVDDERHLIRRKLHARAPGRGLRQGPAGSVEGGCRRLPPARRRSQVRQRAGPACRLASPGMHSFSHTSQVTSASRATGAEASSVARRRDAGEQHRLALVAEVGEMGDGNALRRRPGDRAGREARRQLPGDGRRLARVARVAPVDVPMLLDAQAHADPERLTRLDRGRLGDQLRLHQL